ncbi:MAG: FKBP-type peptidyl-prolyl cis-trans isomerase [Candidatus Sericytochromatia bacterium]|nr:FKBP-type peptidyl-prolyl cis-trans isomerase [Candidatus Sericytochromatia bacterium]
MLAGRHRPRLAAIAIGLATLGCDPTLVPVNPPEPGDGAEVQPVPVLTRRPSVAPGAPNRSAAPTAPPPSPRFPLNTAAAVSLPSGLGYTIIRAGEPDGKVAEKGHQVVVHYAGWLTNGTLFDTSRQRESPFRFKLGAGSVIAGWEQGVLGMRVGEVRKLVIPPQLGYGEKGTGRIPPRSTLLFEVELLELKEG